MKHSSLRLKTKILAAYSFVFRIIFVEKCKYVHCIFMTVNTFLWEHMKNNCSFRSTQTNFKCRKTIKADTKLTMCNMQIC